MFFFCVCLFLYSSQRHTLSFDVTDTHKTKVSRFQKIDISCPNSGPVIYVCEISAGDDCGQLFSFL